MDLKTLIEAVENLETDIRTLRLAVDSFQPPAEGKDLKAMHRTYRVELDITINANSCDVESVELRKTSNIRNTIDLTKCGCGKPVNHEGGCIPHGSTTAPAPKSPAEIDDLVLHKPPKKECCEWQKYLTMTKDGGIAKLCKKHFDAIRCGLKPEPPAPAPKYDYVKADKCQYCNKIHSNRDDVIGCDPAAKSGEAGKCLHNPQRNHKCWKQPDETEGARPLHCFKGCDGCDEPPADDAVDQK